MEKNKTDGTQKRGVTGKIIDGLVASTQAAHKDTMANLAAEKKAAKERHIDAITPRTFKERHAEQMEKEKERRAEIKESTSKFQPKDRLTH